MSTNQTLLLSLLTRCRQILQDTDIGISGQQINTTVSNATVSPPSDGDPALASSREAYDNAYFYILVVMCFYSFLAMTLFRCFIAGDEEKKDPYEEFMQPSTQTFDAGHMAEKFYFEEESSL
uniref:Potassium voltage-gated channel subfamily E regulatory subunit 3 n=1 Tax=Stegastes partitus TaxID=144197 RepID=A0A3B5AH02_9TELE